MARKKIAILGGGLGALSAAFYLTDHESWSEEYEITVYQMGWRLGGKGASGRNLKENNRIEEHGVHVFLGMYHNAFRLMESCYQQLGEYPSIRRDPGDPLSKCFTEPGVHDGAFEPSHLVSFWEQPQDEWKPWNIHFAADHAKPGRPGKSQPNLWQLLRRLIRLIRQHYHDSSPHFRRSERFELPFAAINSMQAEFGPAFQMSMSSQSMIDLVANALDADDLPDGQHVRGRYLQGLAKILGQFRHELQLNGLGVPDSIRRLGILLRTGTAVALGMLTDEVLFRGFDHLDRYELKEWLERHGANENASWSTIIQSIYELVLGFHAMDRHVPDIGAGTSLRGMLRIFLDYDGAVMWKMQAGMGDTVFAPLYLLLKEKGVKFKFFHRVTDLELSADKKSIQKVHLVRQVQLRDKDGNALDSEKYFPLVDCPYGGKPLWCWPSEPVYENDALNVYIDRAEAAELQAVKAAKNLDLESAWIDWRSHESPLTLEHGVDFDDVILGIPVGALPYVSRGLMKADSRWKAMVENLTTVPSQAAQLWMNQSAAQMNCGADARELFVGSYKLDLPQPWPSWIGMGQLVEAESWPAALQPKHLAYLFSQINTPVPDSAIPEPFAVNPDVDFPETLRAQVKAEIAEFLKHHVADLFPCAVQPGTKEFRWELLIDALERAGIDRLDAQYWRININPSDRYVTHATDTLKYRLAANASGFKNLFLAGDWTLTGLNSGCAEAATMSGMQASRAICGRPYVVYWEKDKLL